MKYYIIAGEASGDLHAANLIKSLKHEDANTSIRAWGGDRMKAQGATIVKHYRDCHIYTSDAADGTLRVRTGGLRYTDNRRRSENAQDR